jgi:lipoprotein NlpD
MFVLRSSIQKCIIFIAITMLAACSTTPPAPVVDRLPNNQSTEDSTSSNKPASARPIYKSGDWRPDTYTVKKGDTLFGIGLEYGYDYKELAEINQISAPYIIEIGQILKFNTTSATTANNNEGEVSTFPLGDDNPPIAEKSLEATPQPSEAVVTINEPKAKREPYSEEAFNRPIPTLKPSTVAKAPDVKITEVKPTDAKTAETKETKIPENKIDVAKPTTKTTASNTFETTENIEWAWPHNGKVIGMFNESSNKGLDIAGNIGQPVLAAAAGKVIYSGSDLRGYGKLVIVKHNALYLSVYAHNSTILVKEGQLVSRGQKIAELGNTESSTAKLHFEIRRQGKSVDPKQYLPNN